MIVYMECILFGEMPFCLLAGMIDLLPICKMNYWFLGYTRIQRFWLCNVYRKWCKSKYFHEYLTSAKFSMFSNAAKKKEKELWNLNKLEFNFRQIQFRKLFANRNRLRWGNAFLYSCFIRTPHAPKLYRTKGKWLKLHEANKRGWNVGVTRKIG